MIDPLKYEAFSAQLNSTFKIHYGAEQPLEAELIEVKQLGAARPGKEQPFSLLFRSQGADHYLIQQIYNFEHPELGVLDLFLVPLGPQGDAMLYEIIIG
ncbi:MAG: hypothetical protein JW862_15280 [Anaerolineales bacterium]|nr:hypothetical protein [Anaerolineales bacterium]